MNETPVNILIVDDLPENLLALDALIRGEGRHIHQARSGDEALALLLENEFAVAILDVQMPGMNGFELAELMRGTARTRHIPIVFVTAAGREQSFSFKGYETGAVDFLFKPLDNLAVQSKVNVFVDLFEQRRSVRMQVDALQQARREQDELVVQLKEAQTDLKRAVKMRDEFVSLVSHELRTPLNTLFLEVQMRRVHLGKGDAEVLSPRNMEAMVQREERQIQSMVHLIDDMIDMSRVQRGVLMIRQNKVDLSTLIKRAADSMSHLANEATGAAIELDLQDGISGLWDEFRVEQIVANLLSNALRHGGGKPVLVKSMSAVGSGGVSGARVDVIDEGAGIAAADQERIFGQFERASSNTAAGGMGLGLYIARHIAGLHGGTLTVNSEPGKGATFSLWLPLSPVQGR